MLPTEARWFAKQVARLGDAAVFPMLNVGSHTAEFRGRTQPWIDRHLFGPFAARGCAVTHTDVQAAAGVDLVGDLTDPAFRDRVRALRFRSAFCNNLLEHVPDPAAVAAAVAAAVEPGGYLLVSVPHRFPYHPDPIDTMFRPSPAELARLFPGTAVVAAEKLRCGNLTTYLAMRLFQNPRALARTAGERAKGQTGADRTAGGVPGHPARFLPWLVRPFVQACVVLRVAA